MDPLLMVAIGVPLALLVLYFAVGTRQARIEDADALRHQTATEDPDLELEDIVIGTDHQVALATTPHADRFLLAYAFGDMVNLRVFAPQEVLAVERTPDGLALRIRDFTHPRAHLVVDAADAERWLTRLSNPGRGAAPDDTLE